MSTKIVSKPWNSSDNYDHVMLVIDNNITSIVTYRHASNTKAFVEQIDKLIQRNVELEKLLKSK